MLAKCNPPAWSLYVAFEVKKMVFGRFRGSRLDAGLCCPHVFSFEDMERE